MQKADLLIINIGQLVTAGGSRVAKHGSLMADAAVIEDGAVAIADGKIVAAGNSDEIAPKYSVEKAVNAGGRVVTPGFVDPHTHIVFAGDRLAEFELKIRGAEYLEILEAGGGIISTVENTRGASVDELIAGASSRLEKMLECGTTTCEIKTGYGLDTVNELKMLRVIEELDKAHPIDIVPTFLPAHTLPPEFRNDADGYVDLICGEMLPKAWQWYENSHFVQVERPFFCDVFAEKSAFDLDRSRRILEAAKAIGFGIKAHVDQFTNLGGSQMAIDLDAASIDHLDAISDDEIARLAVSDTIGIVIPTENFSGGKMSFAPARKLIDAGCAVAVSTDNNPGSAPCPSMPMAMAIAARYQKLLPAELLNAATINAAHAIGLGETHGSIEVGKAADLLIWDQTDLRQIVYEFGNMRPMAVIKNGSAVRGNI